MSDKTQNIKSYQIVYPQLYSYILPTIVDKEGSQKIGYTERKNVHDRIRIKQQVETAAIRLKYDLLWTGPAYFHNGSIQANIRNSKEEQFQEGFLRELFVNILGYTLNPTPNFNLTTEYKNVKDSKKADGAILKLVKVAILKRKYMKPSKKLQDWYLLSYSDFIKELAKKKVKLSLSEEAEWEDYFMQESKKALALKNEIDTTDKAIDTMVYELYGLSEEEIGIVENS